MARSVCKIGMGLQYFYGVLFGGRRVGSDVTLSWGTGGVKRDFGGLTRNQSNVIWDLMLPGRG